MSEFVGTNKNEFVGTNKDKFYGTKSSVSQTPSSLYLVDLIANALKVESSRVKADNISNEILYINILNHTDNGIKLYLTLSSDNSKFILKLANGSRFIDSFSFDTNMNIVLQSSQIIKYTWLVSYPNFYLSYDYLNKKFELYQK